MIMGLDNIESLKFEGNEIDIIAGLYKLVNPKIEDDNADILTLVSYAFGIPEFKEYISKIGSYRMNSACHVILEYFETDDDNIKKDIEKDIIRRLLPPNIVKAILTNVVSELNFGGESVVRQNLYAKLEEQFKIMGINNPNEIRTIKTIFEAYSLMLCSD